MSQVVQRRKGLKRKQLTCTNQSRFQTKELAKAYIEKLVNRGQRGSLTLHAFKCDTCSKRQGDIYHVGRKGRAH